MSSRKVSLADLAKNSAMAPPAALAPVEPAEAPPEPPRTPAAAHKRSAGPRPSKPGSGAQRGARAEGSEPGAWVRYDQYERKEARLRPDQYERLSSVSRQLNRTRSGQGERITENTLIRIAIDLLLERGGDLAGTTETELRQSVGL